MNSRVNLFRWGVIVILFASVAAAIADFGDATQVASKISEVTLYADRARVTRTAKIALHAGTSRFALQKLPGWIDEGSVRISLTPPGAGELVDVQIERTFLARPDDEEIRKAEAAVTEISDQLASLDDEAAVLDAQMKQTDAIRVFSLEKLPKDAAVREVKVEEYGGVVKFIGNSMLEFAKSKRELEKKKRELQPQLQARQQKVNDLRQRSQLQQRTVVVTIKASRDGEASLTATYLLPGTTWEPVHELRPAADGGSVTLASYAVVTQTTGEDWENATLTFSTQRPDATARIPELEAMLVGSGRSLARVINPEGDSFREAASNFDVQNGFWNSLNNRGDVMANWGENVRMQRERQAKVVQVFQQVQQRGTTAQFPAMSAQTIRSDGRVARVPIGTARLNSTSRIVAAPELSLNAVQTADLENSSGQPLLPGKVLLYAEGAFVGTTETEFVAPGENFSMFLGVADRIKLARTLDQKRSSLTWTGKKKRMLASFLVTTENLFDKPVVLQLADRIPVSQTDEIRVVGVKLQPDVKPDVKGLVKWEVTLPAKQKKEFRIEYTLEYPAEFPAVNEAVMRSSAKAGRAAKLEETLPAEPQGASDSLYRQIDQLEKSLKK